MAAVIARIRLVHPFPSLLNGLAVLVMALLAGGSVPAAVRLAVGMVCIQFAIGALNDAADARRDASRIPGKPIPAGLVRLSTARGLAVALGVAGLVFAAPSGPATLAIAGAGLGLGVIYDLGLSRTPISWLPLAFALPLVPVYAWLGSVGAVPGAVVGIVPAAILAGAGLAVGNALADLDEDDARGRRTIAVALGRAMAWWANAAGLLGAITVAIVLRPTDGGATAAQILAAGAAVTLAGVGLLWSRNHLWGRVAWGLEASGIAVIGIGWILGVRVVPS